MHSFKPRLIPSMARPGMWYCEHVATNTLGWGFSQKEAFDAWQKKFEATPIFQPKEPNENHHCL